MIAGMVVRVRFGMHGDVWFVSKVGRFSARRMINAGLPTKISYAFDRSALKECCASSPFAANQPSILEARIKEVSGMQPKFTYPDLESYTPSSSATSLREREFRNQASHIHLLRNSAVEAKKECIS